MDTATSLTQERQIRARTYSLTHVIARSSRNSALFGRVRDLARSYIEFKHALRQIARPGKWAGSRMTVVVGERTY